MTTNHHNPTTTDRAVRAPNCTCEWRWGSYGRLYGTSMGEGWIRTTTNPTCPQHAPEESR